MVRIKSTVDVTVYPRTQTSGKIIIEMLTPSLVGDIYSVVVNDYVEYQDSFINESDELVYYTKLELINTKTVFKPKSIINLLFTIPQIEITLTDDYSEKITEIEKQILLYFVQIDRLPQNNDLTIYGLLPEQWEIIN